jgi:hypothetical protein
VVLTVVALALIALPVVTTSLATGSDWAIDQPLCDRTIRNLYQTRNPNISFNEHNVSLEICNDACPGWARYQYVDIQKRINQWVVPLFIIVALMQFAPLGKWNTIKVVLHLFGDPISSQAMLLERMEGMKQYVKLCQGSSVLRGAQLAGVAPCILSSYEEWEDVWYAENAGLKNGPVSRKARVEEFEKWLQADNTGSRRKACLKAANKLADSRASGLWKTIIGTLNYVVAVALGFLHSETP